MRLPAAVCVLALLAIVAPPPVDATACTQTPEVLPNPSPWTTFGQPHPSRMCFGDLDGTPSTQEMAYREIMGPGSIRTRTGDLSVAGSGSIAVSFEWGAGSSCAIHDVDDDAANDILFSTSSSVCWSRNLGSSFSGQAPPPAPAPPCFMSFDAGSAIRIHVGAAAPASAGLDVLAISTAGSVRAVLHNGASYVGATVVASPPADGGTYSNGAFADATGDGLLDAFAAAANGSNRTVVVFVNLAGTAFSAPIHLHSFIVTPQFAVADFTGDGLADLVVSDTYTVKSFDMLAGPTPTVGPERLIVSDNVEVGIIASPSDRVPSIVVIDDTTFTRFRNPGNGVFRRPVLGYTPPPGPPGFTASYAVVDSVDYHANGGLSLVGVATFGPSHGYYVFEPATPSLVLGSQTYLQSSTQAVRGLAVLDVDQDGVLDVVYKPTPSTTEWMRGTGAGDTFSLTPAGIITLPPSAPNPPLSRKADLNADGIVDFYYVDSAGPPSIAYTSIINGAFAAPVTVYSGTPHMDNVLAVDLDGDVFPDFVGLTVDKILVGIRSPFRAPGADALLFNISSDPVFLLLDVYRAPDGALTVYSSSADGDHLVVITAPPASMTFAAPSLFYPATSPPDPVPFPFASGIAADVDVDGVVDFVYAGKQGNDGRVLWLDGNDLTQRYDVTLIPFVEGLRVRGVHDVNGDGYPEIIFSYEGVGTSPPDTPSVYIMINEGPAGGLNNMFSTTVSVGSDGSVPGTLSSSFACADLDADGFVDTLWGHPAVGYNGGLRWRRGTPAFASAMYTPSAEPTLVPFALGWCARTGVYSAACLSQRIAHYSTCTGSATLTYALPSGVRLGCARRTPFTAPSNYGSIALVSRDKSALFDCAAMGGGVAAAVEVGSTLSLDGVSVNGGTPSVGGTASAPLYAQGGLVLANLAVSDCSSTAANQLQANQGLGGAVAVVGGSLTATSVLFMSNTARIAGGALAVIDGSAVVSSSVFASNTALGELAAFGGGGAVVVLGTTSVTTQLTDVAFDDNVATRGSGGALLVRPEAVGGGTGPQLVSCSFARNVAPLGAGGAMAVFSVDPVVLLVSGATLADNSAAFGGSVAVGTSLVASMALSSPAAATTLPSHDGSTAASGIVFSGTLPSTLGGTEAAYGAFVYACGGYVNASIFDSGTMVATGSVRAGTAAYTCLPADNAGTTASAWIDLPAGVAESAGALSSPPLILEAGGVPFPATAISGVALGQGGAVVRDVHGGALSLAADATLVVTAAMDGAGTFASVNQAAMTEADGVVSIGRGLVVTLESSATPAPGAVVRVGIEGLAGGELVVGVDVTQCPPAFGRVSAVGDALVCGPCGPTEFSGTTDDRVCASPSSCRANERFEEGVCVVCEEGTVLVSANTSVAACSCVPGTYTPSKTVNTACLACPDGGVCAGGVEPPVAAPGFFGGESDAVFVACPNAGSCTGRGQCARGYVSRLCAECAANYYRLGGACYKCDATKNTLVTVALVVGVAAVLTALLLFNMAEGVRYKFAAAMIGLNALQISAIYGKLELDWGSFAAVYFDVASSLNLNFELTSPECATEVADPWVFKWVLTLLLPVFAAVGLAVVGGVVACVAASGMVAKNVAQVKSGVVRTFFQVLVLLYLPLAQAAVVLFGCSKDASGRWSLDDDPARSCYNAAWWSLFPLALLATVVYAAALPVGVVLALRRAASRMDEYSFALRFSFLVAKFKPEAWWFEAAIMGRKVGVVVCMTLFAANNSKAGAGAMFLVGSLVQLAIARPYAAPFHNALAITTLGATSAVLYGGTLDAFALRRMLVIGGIVVMLLCIVVGNAVDVWRIVRSEKEVEENEYFQDGVFGAVDESASANGGSEAASFGTEIALADMSSGFDSHMPHDLSVSSVGMEPTTIGALDSELSACGTVDTLP